MIWKINQINVDCLKQITKVKKKSFFHSLIYTQTNNKPTSQIYPASGSFLALLFIAVCKSLYEIETNSFGSIKVFLHCNM